MIHGHFGAAAHCPDFRKGQPVQGIEQEPAALGFGAGVQDGHQLIQRFHAAKVFFRRFAVDTYALGGNYVFVKLPAIPMPPLLMGQVLRENLNVAAGSGTGDSIEKRPDSTKLFERKKHDIHLQNDNFRTAG